MAVHRRHCPSSSGLHRRSLKKPEILVPVGATSQVKAGRRGPGGVGACPLQVAGRPLMSAGAQFPASRALQRLNGSRGGEPALVALPRPTPTDDEHVLATLPQATSPDSPVHLCTPVLMLTSVLELPFRDAHVMSFASWPHLSDAVSLLDNAGLAWTSTTLQHQRDSDEHPGAPGPPGLAAGGGTPGMRWHGPASQPGALCQLRQEQQHEAAAGSGAGSGGCERGGAAGL